MAIFNLSAEMGHSPDSDALVSGMAQSGLVLFGKYSELDVSPSP